MRSRPYSLSSSSSLSNDDDEECCLEEEGDNLLENDNNPITQQPKSSHRKRRRKRRFIIILLVLLIIVSISTTLYYVTRIDQHTDTTKSVISNSEKLLLIRSIGNALPPRHDASQTLVNLEFILANEVTNDDVITKHWVINHIVNSSELHNITSLLSSYNHTFDILPFSLLSYSNVRHNVFRNNNDDLLFHTSASTLVKKQTSSWSWSHLVQLSEAHEDKMFYTIGINAVRNYMIDYGAKLNYKWTLPWDQNCYLTPDSLVKMKSSLENYDLKYAVSWMKRVTSSNNAIISPDFNPPSASELIHEPQLMFRFDAVERFDTQMRYGRRDKCALLMRLGVPGPWDKWGYDSFERSRIHSNLSTDLFNVSMEDRRNVFSHSVGYALRLNSGHPDLESSNHEREVARATGLVSFFDKLDERVMKNIRNNYEADHQLLFYNIRTLERIRRGEMNITSSMSTSTTDKLLLNAGLVNLNSFLNSLKEPPLELPDLRSISGHDLLNFEASVGLVVFLDSVRLRAMTTTISSTNNSNIQSVRAAAKRWLDVLDPVFKKRVDDVLESVVVIALSAFLNEGDMQRIVYRADVLHFELQNKRGSYESWALAKMVLNTWGFWKEEDDIVWCEMAKLYVRCCDENNISDNNQCKGYLFEEWVVRATNGTCTDVVFPTSCLSKMKQSPALNYDFM